MKFGMFYEIQVPRPAPPEAEHQRIREIIDQVRLAEEMGFEQVWFVEHHFLMAIDTDRGRGYKEKSFLRVKQRKCLAHLQRTWGEVLNRKQGRAQELAERPRELLRLAVQLWEGYHCGNRQKFDRWAPEVCLTLRNHL